MKTSKTTHIDAPREAVFPWLEDNDRLMQWIPSLVEDEALVETPEKVGSTFKQVFLEKGRKMEMVGEITAYVENERMRVKMAGDMFDLDADYILTTPSDNQTELTQNTEIRFKGFLKVMTPIMLLMSKFSSKDPQAEAHNTLKALVEAEYQNG